MINVAHVCVLLVVFAKTFDLADSKDLLKDIKNSMINIAKGGQKDNVYLDEFLDSHSQPKIVWNNADSFELNIDTRHNFRPIIKMAPFSSTGEPWPMPKKYTTNNAKLFQMNLRTFKLEIDGSTNDILEDAIRRYTVIIRERIPEEPYDFVFNFNKKTHDEYEKKRLEKYTDIQELGNLKITVKTEKAGYPHIDMDESYTLNVKTGEVTLEANEIWGALRGLETFSQILFRKRNTSETYVRWTEAEDAPRFPHRGILMDTSRHYMHKYVIKNVLDGMSYNKLNVLHWHIVDDNSFPYKSEVYPSLSDKGAFHPTLVYSLKDIKELVAYARLRGIRVVPEFDTPGHMFAWLGVPELMGKCFHSNGDAFSGPIGPVDPVKDESYHFFAKLFGEIFETFPDVFVHLGGDELHSPCWATNPSVVEFLAKNANIPASEAKSNPDNYVHKAIGYYFKRLVGTLKDTSKQKDRGASFIMWEDVLRSTGEIPKDSIIEVWMGKPSLVKSINDKGYRTIYSSCWYLDNYKNFVLWAKYYQCDPSPYFSEADEKGKLLGGEACLWAEYITSDNLMTMMWPRASAPAERLWSPRSVKDLTSAGRRIQEQRCRMIYRGLPTGHIDGPDYCLRYRNEPLGGDDPLGLDSERPPCQQQESMSSDSQSNSFGFGYTLKVDDHHLYLPFNIALSIFGLYLIATALRYIRRRHR